MQKHAEALVQHTARQVQAGQIDARALAKVAYGAARCGRSGVTNLLFAALARAAERRLSEFRTQNIASTAWAFATMKEPHEKLFAALARAAERGLSEFNGQDIANIAWAFATADRWDEKLFAALARAAEPRLSGFTAQELANTAWAFATVKHWDEKLFAA